MDSRLRVNYGPNFKLWVRVGTWLLIATDDWTESGAVDQLPATHDLTFVRATPFSRTNTWRPEPLKAFIPTKAATAGSAS